MSKKSEQSPFHSPRRSPTLKEERLEVTLRQLRETLSWLIPQPDARDWQESTNFPTSSTSGTQGPIRDWKRWNPKTPSTGKSFSETAGQKKTDRAWKLNPHATQNPVMSNIWVNAKRHLEAQAKEGREELSRLYGIRKEYGKQQFYTQGHGTDRRAETDHNIRHPPIHGAGRFSPLWTSWGRKLEVPHPHSHHPTSGPSHNANMAKEQRIDWAAIIEAATWEPCSSSDEIADQQFFSTRTLLRNPLPRARIVELPQEQGTIIRPEQRPSRQRGDP